MSKILEKLDLTIAKRIKHPSNSSYISKLLKKGVEKSAEKFGEEAVELIVASVKKSRKEIIGEAADTLFHMCVLLRCKSISVNDVLMELEDREGMSGIEEKRRRKMK